VFSKDEIKEFIIKFGSKWLFPDFSNKLTWVVVSIGASVIITPSPIKLIIYNWLVDSFNLNYGEHFTIAEVSSGTADYWIGFSLIALALIHNILYRLIQQNELKKIYRENIKEEESDKQLFCEFLKLFPSNSSSFQLLKEHDFGNSFSNKWLDEIEKFVYEWDFPEKQFLDAKREELRLKLLTKSKEFCLLLAEKSSPTGNGVMQSVVPDHIRNEFDWPNWVLEDIKEVNEKATQVAELHQEFITTCKKSLKI